MRKIKLWTLSNNLIVDIFDDKKGKIDTHLFQADIIDYSKLKGPDPQELEEILKNMNKNRKSDA